MQSLGATLPVVALAQPEPLHAAPPAEPLDAALLLAVAEAVLPTELGRDGIESAVAGFREWSAGFEPVAELNHGYGTAELQYAPADPVPGWGAQLRALELESTRRNGRGFASISTEDRRELVRAHLARERVDRLGDPAAARHVAAGLLSWWYATPEAMDLCYRAQIGRFGCRPLARSPERPDPLEGA